MGKHIPLPTNPIEREIEQQRRRTDNKAPRKGQHTRRAREYIAQVRAQRANYDLIGL